MDKIKKILTFPAITVAAFIMAGVLLGFSTIGGARAALTYYSQTYASQMEMHDIGVSLMENGTNISGRDYAHEVADGTWDEHTGVLLAGMLEETDNTLVMNRNYTEKLSVANTGTINEYVRVTVYRYWVDADGNKQREIDPSAINLHLVNQAGQDGEQCWIEDTAAATRERTVLYYNRVLPSGSTTPDFSDTISIDGEIVSHINTWTDANGVTTSEYEHNGCRFVLEATVDAVQDHNAEAAILSAWGMNVSVSDNRLSLK